MKKKDSQHVNLTELEGCSVGKLVEMLEAKQSLTSQQLSIMKYSRLLKSRRNGNVVYYSLVASRFVSLVNPFLPASKKDFDQR